MPDLEFSKHAKHILTRRKILEEWVWRVINTPDKKRRGDDNNMHFIKTIREREGRILHVVINTDVHPNRIVTVFFDRRLGKRK
jgi:hypothetical protein